MSLLPRIVLLATVGGIVSCASETKRQSDLQGSLTITLDGPAETVSLSSPAHELRALVEDEGQQDPAKGDYASGCSLVITTKPEGSAPGDPALRIEILGETAALQERREVVIAAKRYEGFAFAGSVRLELRGEIFVSRSGTVRVSALPDAPGAVDVRLDGVTLESFSAPRSTRMLQGSGRVTYTGAVVVDADSRACPALAPTPTGLVF
ncbi:MAG: hypothetical protein JST00_36880 [Deltaproteobacteria bacterium]|nr:hypothetical protein [Deltaproteobacteria bacterium]